MATNHLEKLQQKRTIMHAAAGVIAVGVLAFVVYPGVTAVLSKSAELRDTNSQLETAETQLAELRRDFNDSKDRYAQLTSTNQDRIKVILPTLPNQTEVTRLVENTGNAVAASQAFFLESVTMSKPLERQDLPYTVLPVKISGSGTEQSIRDFIAALEKTGELGADQATRLLSIKDVNLMIKPETKIVAGRDLGNVSFEIKTEAYSVPEAKKPTKPAATPAAEPAAE